MRAMRFLREPLVRGLVSSIDRGLVSSEAEINALSRISSLKPCSRVSRIPLSPASRSRLLLCPPLQPHHARASPLLEEEGGQV